MGLFAVTLLALNVLVSVIWQPDYLSSTSMIAASFQYIVVGLISLLLMNEAQKGSFHYIVNMLHVVFCVASLLISAYGGYGIIVPLYNS
ncbi:MAG: hypothetical protein CBC55_02705 [Gammaproteobacteria bacterium TMED95]|nr:MAG: hypothetical protein CBC55_02705 [Gammaproteobacteria bacterium TMED95]